LAKELPAIEVRAHGFIGITNLHYLSVIDSSVNIISFAGL
jgi:hypothetical protein